MIDPKRASEIGRPFEIRESDISEIGKAAIVARIIRIAQLALPVITAIMGILAGRYAFPPPQQSSGYPYAMASMAVPSTVIAKRSSWKGVSILVVVGFIVGFLVQMIYSLTRPEPGVILYGVYSKQAAMTSSSTESKDCNSYTNLA